MAHEAATGGPANTVHSGRVTWDKQVPQGSSQKVLVWYGLEDPPAPWVGKSYEMLAEGHNRVSQSADCVIGFAKPLPDVNAADGEATHALDSPGAVAYFTGPIAVGDISDHNRPHALPSPGPVHLRVLAGPAAEDRAARPRSRG